MNAFIHSFSHDTELGSNTVLISTTLELRYHVYSVVVLDKLVEMLMS